MNTITVITTSLNRRDLLRKTMESVLAQDYPAIEQIVIDAGSSDGTPDLLREYEKKYAAKGYAFKWISERDSGQANGMNKGLRMATGKYVTILNSDDFFSPDAIRPLMDVLEKNPEVAVVYGRVGIVNEKGERIPSSYPFARFTLKDVVSGGYQIPQSGCVFARELVDRVGGFNESLRHVAEHDLFVRFLETGAKTYFLDREVEVILEHAGRKTLEGSGRSALEETRRVNFSHGCGYFSRFYLWYLKERYFKSEAQFLKKLFT